MRTVAIPFSDDINFQLSERLKGRNHVETFTLLPSKMISEIFSIEEIAKSLQTKYQSEMTNDWCHFRSELKRYNFGTTFGKIKHQQDQPDSIAETLEFVDLDTAWNVSKYGVISGPYFPVFSRKTRKYGPEIIPYLDTFHAMRLFQTYAGCC